MEMANELVPVESVKRGMGLTIADPAWGRTTYLIHDVEELHDGEEFVVTYGTDSGRWTDTVSFEAGELVEAA
jgi:hypothetical protein